MSDDTPDWYSSLPDANSSVPPPQSAPASDSPPDWYHSLPDAAPPPVASSASPDNTNQSNAATDVGKTLIGNVAPNAVANYAANVVSPLVTGGSYALQGGIKAGEYATERASQGIDYLSGNRVKPMAEYDAEQKDLMNAIRSGIGMSPTDSGDISQLIPTPSNLLNAGMNAMGSPLYQPQTEAGKQTAEFGNVATGAAGSGAKLLPTLMGAAGATGGGEAAKQLGAPDDVQFFSSLLGGLGGGALGSTKAPSETPMSNVEDQNSAAFLGPKTTVESASPILQKLANGEQVTSDDINAHATDVGNAAKTLGATLTPQFAQNWLAATKGPDPTTPVEITNAQNDPLRTFLKPYEDNGFGQSPVSLSDLTSLDKKLGNLAWKERDVFGNISPEGRQILAAQQNLRKMALNASPDNGDAVGDTSGLGALAHSIQLYAQGFRMADIERVQQNAQNATDAGKDGSLVARNGYLSMLNKGKKTVGWDDNELGALRGATKSGAIGGLLNVANSKLIPVIAAGLGHLDMGASALGAQMALKAATNKFQQARTNKLFNTIAGRNFGNQPDYIAMAAAKRSAPPPLQLGAPAIKVPEGGFGSTPEPTPQAPDTNYNSAQRALPTPKEMSYEDMVKAGRILPSQPRPNFVGTSEGQVSAIPNQQVGQYQFGQAEGMPFQVGELTDIQARNGQYQNMPISSQRGQQTFINATQGTGATNRNVVRSQSDQAIIQQDQYFSKLHADHAAADSEFNNDLKDERPYFQNQYATGAKNAAIGKNKRVKTNAGKNVQSNE